MQFSLKNYPDFNSFKNNKLPKRKQEALLVDDEIIQLSLPEIINEINNSNLLNIESKEEIPIVFENFSWLKQAKTTVNNFVKKTIGQEVFEHSIAHYKPHTKTIHIFDRIFNPTLKNEQFQNSYAKLIDSVSNTNFIVNLFVLHEIGHAIYNKILDDKDTNINYGNLTDYFKIDSNNKLHKEHNTILHENFADMFASIAYLTIDKNNPNLIKDLELFSQFRKELKENKYYTFNSLDKVINDYKNNNLSFSNNSQILDYININTNNEIKIRLKESLENTLNSQQHNQQLVYLSHLFKLEDKSFNGIISYLEKEINYVKPLSVMYESEFFQNNNPSSEMTKITQRIRRVISSVQKPLNENFNKNKL